MMPPRGLTSGEAALWRQVAETVIPLDRTCSAQGAKKGPPFIPPSAAQPETRQTVIPAMKPSPSPVTSPSVRAGGDRLDASWDRKLARAAITPDYTLDLHGHTLDQAYDRLGRGIAQARVMGARLVLVITGKPRPVDAADRGHRRGAIRAKVLDWLAAGPHAGSITAIRTAHRRHGGDGALYIVLKRTR